MGRRYLVVDLGGSRVRTAVASGDPALQGKCEEGTDHSRGPESVIDQIVRMSRESMQRASTPLPAISRLAVASPGPLDPVNGIVFEPPNMPGWGEVALGPGLEAALGVPVRVGNDANLGALGEFHYGAGKGKRNLVYLTISTGIGGGVVVEGRLMEGSSGAAAEIGHTTIDRHGPVCKCGNIGCLEMLASGTSIARRFNEAVATGDWSLDTEWPPNRAATAADVARLAARHDPLAAAVFQDAAETIGLGIVSCIHNFNPDVVVLGGGVTLAGPLLFDPINCMVDRHTLPVPRAAVRIVRAELGEDVGLMGAAALARSLDVT